MSNPTNITTLDGYQTEAARTAPFIATPDAALALCGLGIAGEAGEVADEIKKVLFHGRALDKDKLVKEAGDVLWYIAHLCTTLGVDLSDVANANLDKLRTRYPEGFSAADSAARRDVKP